MRTANVLITFFLVLLLPTLASATAHLVVGDAIADMLLSVDTTTGELTEFASVGTPHIISLACDQISGMCYCTDTSEGVNQVLSIDQEHGILYRVDIDQGELVFVGNIGVFWITGADFDPISGELYICIGGLDDSGALYTVDTTTAEATFVASTHRLMGLAFGCDGELYGVNNAWYPNPPGLYRIDKNTGSWETIGEYTGRNLMSIECVDLSIVATERRNWGGVKALFR